MESVDAATKAAYWLLGYWSLFNALPSNTPNVPPLNAAEMSEGLTAAETILRGGQFNSPFPIYKLIFLVEKLSAELCLVSGGKPLKFS